MLDVDPSKCKRERTWGIKVYFGRYKDICESSGDKVIDHLSNFYVTQIVLEDRSSGLYIRLAGGVFSSP